MTYRQQLTQFQSDTQKCFQEAISKLAKDRNEQFQTLIRGFIEDLNNRYKRHCFIFTDAMGQKAIDCYHRVTGERLCYWTCNDGRFDLMDSKISISSRFRDFGDTDLDVEIDGFMQMMGNFENVVRGEHYFLWDGKTDFDHVTDRFNNHVS